MLTTAYTFYMIFDSLSIHKTNQLNFFVITLNGKNQTRIYTKSFNNMYILIKSS